MSKRKELLQKADSVALAVDGWDGEGTQGKMSAIVYHWIDDDWVQHHALLDLVSIHGNQYGSSSSSSPFISHISI
jgi:hypothetical protein